MTAQSVAANTNVSRELASCLLYTECGHQHTLWSSVTFLCGQGQCHVKSRGQYGLKSLTGSQHGRSDITFWFDAT